MSWILDSFSGLLNYLGLGRRNRMVVFMGLDNTGKTTILHLLRHDKLMLHPPTHYGTPEELVVGGIRFTTFELGGHVRRVWKEYFAGVDGIVFLIDCADLQRLEESKMALEAILNDDLLAEKPIAIIGNKIDKPNALNEDQLKLLLDINRLCTGKGMIPRADLSSRPLEVFMSAALKRQGYLEAFQWLSQYLE